jgi:hypothetical protein
MYLVSLTLAISTKLRISLRNFLKFEMVPVFYLGARGKLIREKT